MADRIDRNHVSQALIAAGHRFAVQGEWTSGASMQNPSARTLAEQALLSAEDWHFTAALWDQYEWTHYRKWNSEGDAFDLIEDPRATTPKPSWGQVVRTVRLWIIEGTTGNHARQAIRGKAVEIASAPLRHALTEHNLHVGAGIDHMSSLVHLLDEAKNAGANWPLAIMRDTAHEPVHMWLEEEAQELVGPLTRAKNRAESASNLLRGRAEKLVAIIRDPNGGLAAGATDDEKFAARDKAQTDYDDIHRNIEKHFASALVEADELADGLPPELPRAKRRLIRDLEAASMRQIKALKAAVSQQGVDLPPACDDMEDAEKKVARQQRVGLLAIKGADDIAEAKREYEIAKAKIDAVRALNVPTFHVLGHSAALPTGMARFAQRSITVTVRQRDLEIGKLVVNVGLTSFAMSVRRVRKTDDVIAYELTLTGDDPVTATFQAENLCGYSRLSLTLAPPADE